ncbi:hypothetical protein G7081_02860 [Vagococcus coleopterorum]|uniref:Uncharacterized protein n=1 Tax=Vagococcus coleopterorum TaxID=2714946 RepID=A0A6G8ALX7_9ENTE|nr:hypothetical protein [Vagococcus coleopterorum]QIL46081.1 hypothetical protein G7081_02860 [Vagococcus coleopterorum]
MLKKHTQVSLIKTTPENIVFSDGDVVTAMPPVTPLWICHHKYKQFSENMQYFVFTEH